MSTDSVHRNILCESVHGLGETSISPCHVDAKCRSIERANRNMGTHQLGLPRRKKVTRAYLKHKLSLLILESNYILHLQREALHDIDEVMQDIYRKRAGVDE
jgi:hypothetical protein